MDELESQDSPLTTQPPRGYTTLAIAIIVAALIIGSVAYLTISPTGKTITTVVTSTLTSTTTEISVSASTVTIPASSTGPTSTFPADWAAVCGEILTGNASTIDLLPSQVQIGSTVYPINVTSIYDDIVGSIAFQIASRGNAWVTAEWSYGQVGSPAESYQISGIFILVAGDAPAGYVYAYYTIPGGQVSASPSTEITASCTTHSSIPTNTTTTLTRTGITTETSTSAGDTSSTMSTTTSITCIVSAEGSGFYVTVLSDTGQPIQGVQVSGSRVTQTNGGTCQQNIGTYLTNSTGSVLITPNIGSYYLLSMLYQGKNYTAKAPIEPMTTTYVTLKVPSGNVTITEVYEGGCQTNTGGVTCPG